MDNSDDFKSQPLNISIDNSPFLSLKSAKLRKKKKQSKLTFLKQNKIHVNKKNPSDSDVKNQETTEVKCSSTEGTGCDSQVDENISKEKLVNACPVCWKEFEKIDKRSHMKMCASKHNLTLKQMLDALDLHAKHLEERQNIGLPCVLTNTTVRKVSSRKNLAPNEKIDTDMQLGLALSMSMNESEQQTHVMEQELLVEAGLDGKQAGIEGTLLEKFGFKSSKPVLAATYSQALIGKQKFQGFPTLLSRTQEERDKLLSEKVAILLAREEGNWDSPLSSEASFPVRDSVLKSEVLSSLQNKELSLWMKANSSPKSNDNNTFYVQPLSHVITPTEFKKEFHLRSVSEVDLKISNNPPANEIASDPSNIHLRNELTPPEMKPIQDTFLEKKKIFSPDSKENRTSNPIASFTRDWEKLFRDGSFSDLKIHVQNGTKIPVHKLVLFVRSPNILQDVQKELDGAMEYIDWCEVPYQAALAFLNFIYCGSTSKIDELEQYFEDVVFLSKKYDVVELCCYLTSNPNLLLRTNNSLQNPNDEIVSGNSKNDPNDVQSYSNNLENHLEYELPCSPDPFSNSNELEETTLGDEPNPIRNTQLMMDDLLEALEDNDSKELECTIIHEVEGSKVMNSENSSYEREVTLSNRYSSDNTSVEKRKLVVDSDVSESKRICRNDRKSLKKSFSEKISEEKVMTSKEEEVIIIDSNSENGSECNLDLAEPIPKQKQNLDTNPGSEEHVHEDICDATQGETSFCNGERTIANESMPEEPEYNDVLGDLCADYEYQGFCSTYYPYSDRANSDSNTDTKSSKPDCSPKGPLDCSTFEEKIESHSSSSSSSPSASIKNLTTANSQFLFVNSPNPKKKSLLLQTPSPTVSVKGDASPLSSPVCLSQNKIDETRLLKSEDNDMDKTLVAQDDRENNSHIKSLHSPITPLGNQKRNVSLSSVKRLLEDSFTAELERNELEGKFDNIEWTCSTPVAVDSKSPNPKEQCNAKTEENSVTPMADYSRMETPKLKDELRKYGLKPLHKKRAKQILRHIYNELHPLVPVQHSSDDMNNLNGNQDGFEPLATSPNFVQETSKTTKRNKKNSLLKYIAKNTKNSETCLDESSIPSSQESSSSSENEFGDLEHLSEEGVLSQTDASQLPSIVRNYILSNPVVHQKIILYEPIWLKHLQDALKTQNYKFKLQHLMDYLDEEVQISLSHPCLISVTTQNSFVQQTQKTVSVWKHKTLSHELILQQLKIEHKNYNNACGQGQVTTEVIKRNFDL